jgi:hypothetical protein
LCTPGGFGDVDALKYYAYALPDGSIIYADKAYNDYEIEDLLKEVDRKRSRGKLLEIQWVNFLGFAY